MYHLCASLFWIRLAVGIICAKRVLEGARDLALEKMWHHSLSSDLFKLPISEVCDYYISKSTPRRFLIINNSPS